MEYYDKYTEYVKLEVGQGALDTRRRASIIVSTTAEPFWLSSSRIFAFARNRAPGNLLSSSVHGALHCWQ